MRLRVPDPILIFAFCGFFFFWRIAAFGLLGADEPRYAQVAREMLARHDWVTPTLSGVPWLEKPPLYYWQAMLAFRIFGVSDWAARLPGAMDATVLVIAAYWFLRRFRGECALDGALILATCAGIVGFARAASTDMPLAATVGIAMLAWFAWLETGERKLMVTFYLALGLGVLAKGPVAPLLGGIVILLFAASQRSWKLALKTLSPPGIAAFFVVVLPWYALVQVRNPQFFRVFLLEHNLARFGSNLFHHPEPFWYYIPVTLLGWVPWVIFTVCALVFAARKLRNPGADSLNTFLMIWIGVFVVFFSISQSKLPGYILPAIPPGALLLANFLREMRFSKVHPAVIGLHGSAFAVLLFSALMLPSILHVHRLVWTHAAVVPLMVALVAGAFAALALIKTGWSGLHLAAVAPAIVVFTLALRFSAPVLDQTLSARSVSFALARLANKPLPIAVAKVPRELEFGLQFYRNQTILRYELEPPPAGEHLLIMQMGSRQLVENKLEGRHLAYLGEFAAQNLKFFYVGQ
jgi:4-amino-4-deoxy-L-arabinose transferase-like glycosyltransferase